MMQLCHKATLSKQSERDDQSPSPLSVQLILSTILYIYILHIKTID